ncbi:MAG: Ig-like domain-containing protein [Gemmatimonadota bacterium]|nr:Ig-like domain-containing protein [Gemmatimonadota bacterium]
MSPATVELGALGASAQLTAVVRDQNGRAIPGAAVTWSSSDEAVAVVDASGLVTAAGAGTATVTAAAGGATGTAAVTVAQVPSSVSVEPGEGVLSALGETLRLSAEAYDANGHAVAGAEFRWSSSDEAVAVVDASGLVTAAGAGTATVTAAAGAASGSAVLTVLSGNQPPAAAGELPPHAMIPGETAAVDVTPYFSDPDGDVLSYEASSSDATIVRVSVAGSIVTAAALTPGTATVTVTASDDEGLAATQTTSVQGTTSILTAIRDIDAFLDRCPMKDPAYPRIRQDFELRLDGVVVTDRIVCTEPVSQMALDFKDLETTYPLQYFQLMRLSYYLNAETKGRLPWTDKGLYDWMDSEISGVNYRTGPGSAYCCDVIDGRRYISYSLAWSSNGETGPLIFPVEYGAIAGSLALFAHETRHADSDDPGHVSCELGPAACDAMYDLGNLGGYGVHYWIHASLATGHLHVGIGCSLRSAEYVSGHTWGANVLLKHFVSSPPPRVSPDPPYGGLCIPLDTPWK